MRVCLRVFILVSLQFAWGRRRRAGYDVSPETGLSMSCSARHKGLMLELFLVVVFVSLCVTHMLSTLVVQRGRTSCLPLFVLFSLY